MATTNAPPTSDAAPLNSNCAQEVVHHIFGDDPKSRPDYFTVDQLANSITKNVAANYKYVVEHAPRGDVSAILAAMDEFGVREYTKGPMINLGDVAGAFLDAQVERIKPKVTVELGAFAGYGALRMAHKMKEVVGPSAHVYSFEVWGPFADMCEKLFEYAEMSDMITMIRGSFADKVDELQTFGVEHADLVLIDHLGDLYLSDLHLMERKELLKKGTLVLADNVVFFHIDDYCAYVRASPLYETHLEEWPLSYRPAYKDGMEVSTYLGPSSTDEIAANIVVAP